MQLKVALDRLARLVQHLARGGEHPVGIVESASSHGGLWVAWIVIECLYVLAETWA